MMPPRLPSTPTLATGAGAVGLALVAADDVRALGPLTGGAAEAGGSAATRGLRSAEDTGGAMGATLGAGDAARRAEVRRDSDGRPAGVLEGFVDAATLTTEAPRGGVGCAAARERGTVRIRDAERNGARAELSCGPSTESGAAIPTLTAPSEGTAVGTTAGTSNIAAAAAGRSVSTAPPTSAPSLTQCSIASIDGPDSSGIAVAPRLSVADASSGALSLRSRLVTDTSRGGDGSSPRPPTSDSTFSAAGD